MRLILDFKARLQTNEPTKAADVDHPATFNDPDAADREACSLYPARIRIDRAAARILPVLRSWHALAVLLSVRYRASALRDWLRLGFAQRSLLLTDCKETR